MQTTQTKPTWDIAVRLFHWTLVISFITSYLSGDEDNPIHIYSGYLIVGLLIFRIIWGFIGGRHARFSNFIYRPKKVLEYGKTMLSGKVEHIEGHNPLGGLMVVALLLSLVCTTVTGLKVYGLEGHGPLAQTGQSLFISEAYASAPYTTHHNEYEEDEGAEHFWEEIHEFFANFTVLLVALHITGVVVSSRLEKQNLVKAMITGHKQSQP